MDNENTPNAEKTAGFATVPPQRADAVPEAASARLTWAGPEGEELAYSATAAHVPVVDDAGTLLGRMFSLAFVAVDKDGKPDPARPVTFAYNGGPGSSSVPIDFGGIGPKRVATDGTSHLRVDAALQDNPGTILPSTDLVFLDALGTGWSPLAADADPKLLFSTDGDADAFARAVCAWLEANGRWGSPVYLFGESYGTVRNAVLMRLLGERGVALTGVVMLSAVFNVGTLFSPGSDLAYLGLLPTYAATAQFFGLAGGAESPDDWFDAACDFAEGALAPALLQGDALDDEAEDELAERMAELTGLPAAFLRARHLRVPLEDFRSRLLEGQGQVCGRLDTRYAADAPSPCQGSAIEWIAGEDAADDAVESVWTKAFRAFCADELGYEAPARYLNNNYAKVNEGWDWSHKAPGMGKLPAPDVSLDVAVALRRSPTLKLAILGGRYDAATPWWNVEHDVACQFLSPALKERVEWHRYGCGHMAYTDEPTLMAMAADLKAFYAKN